MRYLIALMFTLAASTAFAAFTDNGDGTVTDSTTGLTWKRCLEGQTFAAGPPAACNGAATAYNWSQALAHALTVGDGWRVPNIKELQSIVDEAKSTLIDQNNPPPSGDDPTPYLKPAIDTTWFPTPAGVNVYVWSASPYTGDNPPTKAWLIDFNTGVFLYTTPMSTTLNVRLVKP